MLQEWETPALHNLKIILGQWIKNVEVIAQTKRTMPELFISPAVKISQEAIAKRKNAVMQLLVENRFPVKEEGNVLRIEDTVSIEPPYYPENCISTNSIILNRIYGILTRVNDCE